MSNDLEVVEVTVKELLDYLIAGELYHYEVPKLNRTDSEEWLLIVCPSVGHDVSSEEVIAGA